MKRSEITPGLIVTINSEGDMMSDGDIKHHINKTVFEVEKLSRGGMVVLKIPGMKSARVVVPPRNVTPHVPDPVNIEYWDYNWNDGGD